MEGSRDPGDSRGGFRCHGQADDPAGGVGHQASAEALSAFGDGSVYLEKYVYPARHVELQILADEYGTRSAWGSGTAPSSGGTRS